MIVKKYIEYKIHLVRLMRISKKYLKVFLTELTQYTSKVCKDKQLNGFEGKDEWGILALLRCKKIKIINNYLEYCMSFISTIDNDINLLAN